MAEFTPLSGWKHLQDTKAANEIVLAYSERRQCVGDSAIDPLGKGVNAQDTAFWRGMQTWVTQQAGRTSGENRWLNYEDEEQLDGLQPSGDWTDDLPYMTLVDFKTLTGLTGGDDTGAGATVGWRRATSYDPAINDWTDYNDPMYEYGPIQAGDIRGPWIFEDLQKAFDALRLVGNYKTLPAIDTTRLALSSSDKEDTISDAVDDAIDKWTGTHAGPFVTDVNFMYLASKDLLVTDEAEDPPPEEIKYQVFFGRRTGDAVVDTNPNIPNIARAYVYPVKIDSAVPYNDVDFPENKIALARTTGEETEATRTVNLTNLDAVPNGGPAFTQTTTPNEQQEVIAVSQDAFIVTEHKFSHTLPEPE
jgi:hypothetical protein